MSRDTFELDTLVLDPPASPPLPGLEPRLAARVAGLAPAQRALFELALRKAVPSPAPSPSVTIPRRGPEPANFCPLAVDQERLWFIQQLDPLSPIYNVYSAKRLAGPLDVAALSAAVAEVVRRHEILRTTFPERGGRPVQEIHPPFALGVPLVDLSGLPDDRREEEAGRAADQAVSRPFDLRRLPLLRPVLFRLDDEDHVQTTAIHHLITDRVTIYVLEAEVAALYGACREGRPSPLPEPPIQYADFALWQRARLGDEARLAPALAWWRERLAGAPHVLELPTDRPRPEVQRPRGARRRFSLSLPQSLALRDFSRRQDVTMFVAGLAVWMAQLARLANQERLIVGTPMNYREIVELPGVLGYFLNQVALYADLSGNPTFGQVLARVRETALGAYAHHEVPFARLLEAVQPARDLSRVPLTQVVFLLLDPPQGGWPELPGIEGRPYWVEAGRTQFDMVFALFWNDDTGITGLWEYSTDLYDPATIDRFKQQFRTLLGAALADPGQRLWDLPLLPSGERHQLAVEWGSPAEEEREAAADTLDARFRAAAAANPGAVAVRGADGELTYAELDRRSDLLVARLAALARPGERVALAAERTAATVVGILGILKAGCAYVPIDPADPAERQGFVLRDAGVAAWVARAGGPAAAVAGLPEVAIPGPDEPASLPGSPFSSLQSLTSSRSFVPEQPAYVIYTSGSTGQPKGVVVPHANVLRLFAATAPRLGLGPRDVWTLFHSFAFDFSVWELWGALLDGGRLVVVPYATSRSPTDFAALLEREGVTVLNQTPSAFRALQGALTPEGARALRWVIFGGEALDPRTLAPWLEKLGNDHPRLINMYGITETTVHVTWRRIVAADAIGGTASPIGAPLPHLGVQLLDLLGGAAPRGAAGEIAVAGGGVAMGYLGRPELTAARFVPDPWGREPGARLYRSGDLGRFAADGDLVYLGRIDGQVKVRGFRIELAEVEAALAAHPAVAAAAVVARAEGTGEQRLVAYYVPLSGAAASVEELRDFLARRLPEPMLPAAFVALPALPLTVNGKLDWRALPAPDAARPALATRYAEPRTAEEAVLAAVWAEVLGLERVGVHDNFFALGGDSILSLRAVGEATRRGLALSLPDFFRNPTIAGLAAARGDEGGESGQRPPFALVPPADRARLPAGLADAYPATALQQGMLYHQELTPEEPLYHDVGSYHLAGPYDPRAFARALERVVARHPALRTSFDLAAFGLPLQLVHRAAPLPLAVEDLTALPEAAQEAHLAQLIAGERRRPFAATDVPQLRFRLSRRAPRRFQLTFALGHAALDGWSLHALLTELFTLYLALARGEEPAALPPPAVSPGDYVALEQEATASAESAAFFADLLADLPEVDLPRWPQAEPRCLPRVRHRLVPVADPVFAGLHAAARQAGVPLKSLLLAVHGRALATACGRAAATGLVTNGRPEAAGGDQVLGLFLNTLPLVLAPGEGSWRDLARAAFAVEEALLPHRRHPFARLQQGRERPLFDVAFNYVHFHVARALLAGGGVEVLGVVKSEGVNFPLIVNASQGATGDGLAFHLEYDAWELPPAQMVALGEIYARALAAAAADPGAPAAAPLLSPAERHQLTREWSQPLAAPEPPFPSVLARFAKQVGAHPEAEALRAAGETWSYARLDQETDALAAAILAALPSGTAEPVIGVATGRAASAVALLAVLKVGGAFLPLDTTHPAARLATILEDAHPSLLLADPSSLPSLQSLLSWGLPILTVPLSEAIPPIHTAAERPGASAAYLIYTSGSTGRPKGVVQTHETLAGLVAWQIASSPETATSRTLQFAAPTFDVSVQEVLATWCAGGCLVVPEEDERRDPERLLALLERERIERLFLPFVALDALAEAAAASPALPASLREIVTAGEALRVTPALRRWCGASGMVLRNQYGPTETHVATEHRLAGAAGEWPGLPPIGRPVTGLAAWLLGPDLVPVPLAAPGELYLGGGGLARGYLGRPEWTAERFVPDAASGAAGARLYRTGDLARFLPGGELAFLGRADEQVKVRGVRVEPGEIEAALAALPAVREAVVALREGKLVAWVVPRPTALQEAAAGEALEPAALRRELAARLPEPMVPAAFVRLERLPRTASGKLDRRALPAPAGRDQTATAAAYEPPRGPIEEALAALWSEVLGVPRVGREDHFFALGGHSLSATRMISRARVTLSAVVTLADLFALPTLAALAGRIQALTLGEPEPEAVIVPTAFPGTAAPLSAAQRRVWNAGPAAAPNLPFELGLRGKLDVPALARALAALVVRQAVLRTAFRVEGGEPVQVVAPPPPCWELPVVDLAALPAPRQEDALALARGEVARPFDLGRAPLFRTLLAVRGGSEHTLLAALHPLVADEGSLNVLVRDLAELYRGERGGVLPLLPPLPVEYVDFARWQGERLAGPELGEARAPGPAATLRRRLPWATGERLRRLAEDAGSASFVVLATALKALLSRRTGETDLTLGTVVSGRDRAELDDLMGPFSHLLALRGDLSGDPGFVDLLERESVTALAALTGQEIPSEREAPPRISAVLTGLGFGGFEPLEERSVAGLTMIPIAVPRTASIFDLEIHAEEGEEGVELTYLHRAFTPAEMAAFADALEALLEAALARPEARLSEL